MLTRLTRPFRGRWRVTASVVFVLCLGLTVSAALFVVADGVLIRPFPVRDPDQLVVVGPASEFRRGRASAVTPEELEELAGLPGVVGVSGYTEKSGYFEERFVRDESLRETSVTADFFRTLGVAAQRGRTLERADGVAAEPRRVVIGDALWRSRFGRVDGIVGQVVTLGGRRVEVVGVMAEEFDLPHGTNVWLECVPRSSSAIRMRSLMPIVRLGVPRLGEALRLSGERLIVEPLRAHFRPEGGRSVAALFVATLIAVLIAWTHLASLQVGQAFERWRELALRAALGAGRWRLAQEWISESVVLSGVALVNATVALPAAVALLVHLLPPELTTGQPIAASGRSLAYLGALTLAGSSAMALGPILLMRQERLFDGLRGRVWTLRSGGHGPTRMSLLAGQVALVATLLYLAGLALHRFVDVARADLGVDSERLIAVDLPDGIPEIDAFDTTGLLARVRRVPFVTAVATGNLPILAGRTLRSVQRHAPRSRDEMRRNLEVTFDASPGYFDALGMRILWGSADGTDRTSDSVLLSETMAKSLGIESARDDLTVYVGGLPRQVVGVVSDVWGEGPDTMAPGRYVYLSSSRARDSLIIRTSKPGAQVVRSVVAAVREVTGADGPITATLGSDLAARVTAPARSRAGILTMLALASLALGAVGVFSMANDTARRQAADDAIRAALGATPGQIVRRQMAGSMMAVFGGLVVGLACGIGVGRVVSGLVEGVRPVDPLVGACVSVVLFTVGVISAVGPALRSARADTMTLLRAD